MFQIYWPPLPGQTEECFRKGKDPRVSLAPCVLSLGGVSLCPSAQLGLPALGLCCVIPPGMAPVGLAGQLMLGQSKGPC